MQYFKTFSVALVMVSSVLIYSCKTSQKSSAKDIGLSPNDLTKDQLLIWQTADTKVHYGACPVGSASVNRNCIGLSEKYFALTFDQYSQALVAFFQNSRPAGSAAPAMSPQDAIAYEKMKRLQGRVDSNTLTPTVEASFKSQIAILQAGLNATVYSPSALSAEEKKLYDAIVLAMQAGKDVVYDEGQDLFDISAAPFTGANSTAVVANCQLGGKPIDTACWYLAKADESCKDFCSNLGSGIVVAPETTTFAGSGGNDANCDKVASTLVSATSGGQYSTTGLGCFFATGYNYRDGVKTNDEVKNASYQRFCACK